MKYESQMKRSKLAWVVWLFPIVALLIITSMYIHERNEEGTYITINFKSADGLIEGRTPVKYRGVTIGTIQSIKITEDDTSVDALVEIKKEYHKYVVKNSRFWLVEPQISLSGISGLSTLKDGVYIAVEPGPLNGDYQDNFKISTAPSAKFEKPNLVSYFLKTNHLKSITINDQINYRGVPVGQVVGISLGKHGAYASVQIGIESKYSKLIRTNTLFWRKEAIKADIGLLGADISVGSLEQIMKGGIELATPNEMGELAKAGAEFTLSEEAPKEVKQWNPKLL